MAASYLAAGSRSSSQGVACRGKRRRKARGVVHLIGYVDRFSVRPGERIAVKVSSRLTEPYQADLVWIVHSDPNPAGPGLRFEEVAAAFAGTYPSRFQPVHSGSYGIVRPDKALTLPDPCTIVVRGSHGCPTHAGRPYRRSQGGQPCGSLLRARV